MSRTLTTIYSKQSVIPGVQWAITPADASTTFLFSGSERGVSLRPPTWEIPFGGGLGKPASYQITLAQSASFWSANKKKLANATVRVTVYVNSDQFQPHVGLIRGIQQDDSNPNLCTLDVWDKSLTLDPLFPEVALSDSWTAIHPEHFVSGATAEPTVDGYGYYAGEHNRPFFFSAVTCDLSTLLGPQNVSSANHVSSIFFVIDHTKGITSGNGNCALFNKAWDQTTNVVCGGLRFELTDQPFTTTPNMWKFTERIAYYTYSVSGYDVSCVGPNYAQGHPNYDPGLNLEFSPSIEKTIRFDLNGITKLTVRRAFINVASMADINNIKIFDGTLSEILSTVSDGYNGDTTSIFSSSAPSPIKLIGAPYIDMPAIRGTVSGRITAQCSLQVSFSLVSNAFTRYSVFAPPVSSADIAISQNPIAILDDIFSHHLSIPYRQDQSSAAQANLATLSPFDCFWMERERTSTILDEFGTLTGTYLWFGDSGMINYRTYVQSATATGSIDGTVTANERLSPLHVEDNMLGFGRTSIVQADRVSLSYGYDFVRGAYLNHLVRDVSNNALCSSMHGAGVRNTLALQTRHILSDSAATFAINNAAQRHAQAFQSVVMTLPAAYFTLELADIIRVNDVMLPSSSDLFQVYRLTQDWLKGTVEVTAGRIQNADGS